MFSVLVIRSALVRTDGQKGKCMRTGSFAIWYEYLCFSERLDEEPADPLIVILLMMLGGCRKTFTKPRVHSISRPSYMSQQHENLSLSGPRERRPLRDPFYRDSSEYRVKPSSPSPPAPPPRPASRRIASKLRVK